MIGNLNFLKMKNAQFDENYETRVLFVNNQFKTVEDYIEKIIVNYVNVNFFMNKTEITNIQETQLYSSIHSLIDYGSKENDLGDFLDMADEQIFGFEQKNTVLNQKQNLLFLIELLPQNIQKNFLFKRKWLKTEFTNKLRLLLEKLFEYLLEQMKMFKKYIASTVELCLTEYFTKSLLKANSIEDLNSIMNYLQNFLDISKVENFEFTYHQIYRECPVDKVRFAQMEEIVDSYKKATVEKLTLDSTTEINLIENSLNSKIFTIFDKINRYRIVNEPIWNDGGLTITGFFVKISEVMDTIVNSSYVSDLKTVRIYSMNSVIFDQDFKIPSNKYKSKHPDLFIFAPRIIVEKRFKVDLSSEHVPGYPNDIEKAKNGVGNGANGHSGENGLPGFNGGNFLLVANSVSGYYIDFVSKGGKGGPGQNGIKFFNIKIFL